MGFVFVTGGARSGKSELADRLGHESGTHVTFIATATAGDVEMEARIRNHRSARPSSWSTVEAPLELLAAIAGAGEDDFVIVDCLTLWVSNLIGDGCPADEVRAQAVAAARELARRRGVVVTNEVGLGIVPANELARMFRDLLGAVNSTFAAHADRAVLMVAGRSIELS